MEKPFKTSDLGIAAYLNVKGLELLGCVESGEHGRLFFVFRDTPERDTYLEEFTSGRGQCSAKDYFYSLRRCKKFLQEPVA